MINEDPIFKAVSALAHEDRMENKEQYTIDTMSQLGLLVTHASNLCGPHLYLLAKIAKLLRTIDCEHEQHYGERRITQ
jgi:hypothetical protein